MQKTKLCYKPVSMTFKEQFSGRERYKKQKRRLYVIYCCRLQNKLSRKWPSCRLWGLSCLLDCEPQQEAFCSLGLQATARHFWHVQWQLHATLHSLASVLLPSPLSMSVRGRSWLERCLLLLENYRYFCFIFVKFKWNISNIKFNSVNSQLSRTKPTRQSQTIQNPG